MGNLVFRTDDPLKWGIGKGANLTPGEVDSNFYDLDSRLTDAENNPAQPKQIQAIAVANNQMTITLSDGVTTFGPYALPEAAFAFTDAWQASHAYAVYDFFTAANGFYMVLQAHTSGTIFNANDGNLSGPFYKLIMPFPTTYQIGFFFPGMIGNGVAADSAMFALRFPEAVYIPAGFSGSSGGVEVAPLAGMTFPVFKNAVQIGTVQIAAAATVATFTLASAVQFAAGDRLRVIRPADLDIDARDFALTIAGVKGTL